MHLILIFGALASLFLTLFVANTFARWKAEAARTYFIGLLKWHCPPEDDTVMDVDEAFGFMDSRGVKRVAPKGLRSDGVSVGQLLRIPIIGLIVALIIHGDPFRGPFRPGGVIHDGLYALAKAMSYWRALLSRERAEADRVIREAALCTRVLVDGKFVERKPAKVLDAAIVWAALRIGGFKAWADDGSKAQQSLAGMAANHVAALAAIAPDLHIA